MTSKRDDLAAPGIGTYEEVAEALPENYEALLTPMETMKAVFAVKNYIEEHRLHAIDIRDGCRAYGSGNIDQGLHEDLTKIFCTDMRQNPIRSDT